MRAGTAWKAPLPRFAITRSLPTTAGGFQCVDLNTMGIKYVVDLTDETDSTVVVEENYDDNTIYLYTGSQVAAEQHDLGEGFGYSYQRKINA